jgi:hypothetical protein
MSMNRLFAALSQQQNAQPALGSLQKTTPAAPTAYQMTAPAAFQSSSTPWQQQIAGAIDYGTAGGDAWNTIGKDGVINYMGDSLMKRYGTNNLSDFRYVEDAAVPGGYRLDWAGRQAPTGFLSGLKNASRSTGLSMGAGAGDSGDGLGGGMAMEDPSKGLNFGATWEGEGGTTFGFYRKPDNSVGIRTGSAQSNDKGDIIAGIATVLGGMALGGALGGAAAGGAAGAGAGAAEGAAAAGAGSAGTAGAVGSGAGFVGEGALSGIGAWDAALAASPSWTAAGGMAGGAAAGASGGGGGAATTGGGFVGEGAASGIPAWDGAAGSGVVGAGGAGGSAAGLGGSGGTPPPANPYHPASYLNTSNLSNLASSGMSNFSWTDLIGPGLQLVGGAMNAKAAGDASDDLLQASREAAARAEPWRQAGAWAIGQGATMLGKEGPEAAKAAFQVDPGYQWRQEQGEKALTRNAAARGLMGSGKFLKDAMRFNQGEASQEFSNSFNRLMAAAGMGQTANREGSDYLTSGASAAAAGRIGQANAWNNALGQGVSMYNNNRLMRGPGY